MTTTCPNTTVAMLVPCVNRATVFGAGFHRAGFSNAGQPIRYNLPTYSLPGSLINTVMSTPHAAPRTAAEEALFSQEVRAVMDEFLLEEEDVQEMFDYLKG